jgi:hypothetical protein
MDEQGSIPGRGRDFSLHYHIQTTSGTPVLGNKKCMQNLVGNLLERDCLEERDKN